MNIQDNFFKILSVVLAPCLIIVVVAAIILAGGQGKSSVSGSPNQSNDLSQVKISLSLGQAANLVAAAKDACVKKGIASDNDLALQLCAIGFYQDKAKAEGNPEICSVNADDAAKTSCLDAYYYSRALSSLPDPSACQKLSDAQRREPCANEANYYLASLHPDKAKDYCGEITTDSLKKLCLDNFAK